MKDIFHDFTNGSSREKLSIISDFSTILGVSVATFVAGPFLSKFADIEFVLSDFILSILFYFICLYLAGNTFYEYVVSSSENYKSKKYGAITGNTILFLLFIWVCSVGFPYAKYYTGNIFNVSYLLALPARSAVKGVNDVKLLKGLDITKVSISLSMSTEADSKDYIAVIYMQDNEGLYRIVRYGSTYDAEYEIPINNQGSILAPLKLTDKNFGNPYLVIFRKSDWSFLEKAGGRFGYPSELTQIPTNDIDSLGAYIQEIELNKSSQKDAGKAGASA